MKELTKAEEQVMQVLWKLKKAFVKDIIEQLPLKSDGKKYAYNTVSTIVRILEDKEFVGHKAYGKTHEYFPLVDKSNYSNFYLNSFIGRYFGGSFEKMVSFFVKQNNIDLDNFEELMKYAEEHEANNPGQKN
ncbi:MAG TPA: transcriptional regulator [Microscillaceae bacterium]|nr:transcriptional regulator [Microscillaceae bacterium]